MQNLTARYNYLYNANLILSTYQEELSEVDQETFEEILPVYAVPKDDKSDISALDPVIGKAQAIISDKGFSNYVDDAYMLLGKANFYQKNYFTAEAYFDYVAQNYKDDTDTYFQALTWKARALMQLGEDKNAQNALTEVEQMLRLSVEKKEDAFTTLAQMAIRRKDYENAILFLKAAINESSDIESRTRWPYILGQLYEAEKDYVKSLSAYNKAENSNVSFEIYFNAKISKIRVNGLLNNLKGANKRKALTKLLKDDKNDEFVDQIYFQIGESYLENKEFKKAVEQFNISIQKSQKNAYQKAKSYLRIADVDFKHLGKYVEAKLYYDSALSILPKTHPSYEGISKKSKNLAYLSERYLIISKEDTAQYIANLPEKERYIHIQKMFSENKKKTEEKKETKKTVVLAPNFYFNNEAALSTGFAEFKKKWGNRPWEDNWRKSTKKTQETIGASKQNNQNTINKKIFSADAEVNNKVKNYIDSLPLTAEKLEKSNLRVLNAYYEIARFYQHELNEKEEALKIYELLIDRFSINPHLDAIYYSLYVLYNNTNRTKAERYKTLILEYYPNSIYVKAILDANFSIKINSIEAVITKDYNKVFDLYEKNNFSRVITQVDESLKNYPDNRLQPQYEYLKAISIGHTQNVDSLLNSFNSIVVKHSKDSLITPLVKKHIEYLNANLSEYQSRSIALPDSHSMDFYTPTKSEENKPINNPDTLVNTTVATNIAPAKKDTLNTLATDSLVEKKINLAIAKPIALKPIQINPSISPIKELPTTPVDLEKTTVQTTTSLSNTIEDDKTFSKTPASFYYFVINIADASLTVTSSRYGVGQFNGGNFPNDDLKHKLIELDNDQMIYIVGFKDLEAAKNYEKRITPQLRNIMKVPSNIYSSFVVSKENFEKITNRDLLLKYQSYYKKNY